MVDIDISNIDAGDFVTAKFSDIECGEFVVSGTARQVGHAVTVGGWKVWNQRDLMPGPALLEVTEHRAQEPDVGFFGVADDGTLWARSRDNRWLLINTYDGIVGKGYSWEQVVDILDGAGLMPVTA